MAPTMSFSSFFLKAILQALDSELTKRYYALSRRRRLSLLVGAFSAPGLVKFLYVWLTALVGTTLTWLRGRRGAPGRWGRGWAWCGGLMSNDIYRAPCLQCYRFRIINRYPQLHHRRRVSKHNTTQDRNVCLDILKHPGLWSETCCGSCYRMGGLNKINRFC